MRSFVMVVGFAASLIPLHVFAQSEPVNALWGSTTDRKGLHYNFGMYSSKGVCPELRAKGTDLVFSTDKKDGALQVADLRYCFALVTKPLDSINCRSGKLKLAFDAKANQFKGEYSFELVDGTKREGSFVAAYCAPAKPGAK